ncbi:MAG: CBS domain-containing protein [Verrucomicrobiales bacterium]
MITRECVRHVDGWRGYALAFGIGVGVYLLWVEMVPKSLFRQFPYRLLTFFLPLLRLIDGGLAPVLGIARLFSSPGQSVDRENGDARAEFLRLAETIEKDGALGRVEARLIRNAVALRELPARDLMVPAGRVTAVQPGMAADAIFDLSRSTGLDQFPVMDPQGNYAGLVLVIDVLRRVPGTGATAADFQKRILRAKPDDSALSVLLRLRRIGIPLAAIYPDGKGGRPLGIVGASDILKRLTEADREPAESR